MRAAAPTLNRYLAREVTAAVAFILLGFLGLFAFFDMLGELRYLGRGEYHLRQILLFTFLSAPTNAYELLPVAVLIGTLYVCAHLSNNSEFTVMRAAGMSPPQASGMLLRTGLAFAVVTFAIEGNQSDVAEFMNRLEYFAIAEGLGGVESIVGHPRTMSHSRVPEDRKAELGLTENLVRLSVGIENPDDLCEDLAEALDAAARAG